MSIRSEEDGAAGAAAIVGGRVMFAGFSIMIEWKGGDSMTVVLRLRSIE